MFSKIPQPRVNPKLKASFRNNKNDFTGSIVKK
jgi:hypothetical protein